jgi:predicted dehydrogenase
MMVRWGLVGCGDIAEKRVVAALQGAASSTLVACTRRDASRLDEFRRRHGIPRGYTRYEDLLNDREIDAVYLATPVDGHLPQALAAAEAGKHVLCEKPMALSVAECMRMVHACRANRVRLGVAYYRRFYPVVACLHALVAEGHIGEPVHARVTLVEPSTLALHQQDAWRFAPARSGGGLLMDMASHRLDLLASLFGLPLLVSAFTSARRLGLAVEDTGSVQLEFQGEMHAQLFASHCGLPVDEFTITGTAGSLTANPLNGTDVVLRTRSGEQVLSPGRPANLHQPLVEDFVEAVLQGRDPLVSGEEGVKASAILEAAYRSAAEGTAIRVAPPVALSASA